MTVWQEIDIEASIEAHRDASSRLSDTIDKFILGFVGPQDPVGRNQGHAKAIAACVHFENRLLGVPSC